MKTKTLKWLSLFMITVLSVGFSSCEDESSSDSDSDNPSGLVATLQANKWVNRDVSDWNDTSYGGYFETSTRIFYFMDDNVGYVYEQYKDYDSSLGTNRSTYFGKFSYTVSGNTVTIRSADTGNTSTYKYSGGYLVWSDSYYEPAKMTSSDYSFVNEKAENLEYEQNIYRYVEVTDEFDEENITVNITIETELSEKYPKETFKYGVEWGFGYFEDISYFDLDGTSFLLKVPVLDLTVDGSTCMRTYTALQEKVANGEKLTSDEKTLMDACIEIINDELKKFQARVFVEANGIKYYVEEDIYAGTIDFDPKYEPDEDSSSSTTIQGHEYVDLGLSVKWATCNVGASKPEGYGDYYAWGETTTKSNYDWDTYKWCQGSGDSMTKYCTSSSYGKVDNKSVIELSDDVAYVKWGNKWRMPTEDEMDELTTKCSWKWTKQSGVNGYLVTGPNGKTIFLPASGFYEYDELCDRGEGAIYWTSSLHDACDGAYYLDMTTSVHDLNSGWLRSSGCLVRPVTE